MIELQLPDEDARSKLWDRHLPALVPRDENVDLRFLVRFELSGGNTRNACLAAAFRAAAHDRSVSMDDPVRGVAREYAKLGRMCSEAEFGEYHSRLRESKVTGFARKGAPSAVTPPGADT